MTQSHALYSYLLRLGDQALIHGHRLSELCSKGPLLEEDLAITNIALDYIGRAQFLLQYAAKIEGKNQTDDDLAYRRAERAFLNPLITELPNGDFAFTIAKQFLLSTYEKHLFNSLIHSKDAAISNIAQKAIKEIKYHYIHAQEWAFRLALGTEISHQKLHKAFDSLWSYTGEFFEEGPEDIILQKEEIIFSIKELNQKWIEDVHSTLSKCKIQIPPSTYMQTGSRQGIHTEYLGHILSEMQYLQRAYPDAKW
jgi:ring-1,2-phenylacetyl-CoA epoxidase subunit PaaC